MSVCQALYRMYYVYPNNYSPLHLFNNRGIDEDDDQESLDSRYFIIQPISFCTINFPFDVKMVLFFLICDSLEMPNYCRCRCKMMVEHYEMGCMFLGGWDGGLLFGSSGIFRSAPKILNEGMLAYNSSCCIEEKTYVFVLFILL